MHYVPKTTIARSASYDLYGGTMATSTTTNTTLLQYEGDSNRFVGLNNNNVNVNKSDIYDEDDSLSHSRMSSTG